MMVRVCAARALFTMCCINFFAFAFNSIIWGAWTILFFGNTVLFNVACASRQNFTLIIINNSYASGEDGEI